MTMSNVDILHGLVPDHDNLVGVDSDGCVFDTMEIKQKQCFHPAIVAHWGLEAVAPAVHETACPCRNGTPPRQASPRPLLPVVAAPGRSRPPGATAAAAVLASGPVRPDSAAVPESWPPTIQNTPPSSPTPTPGLPHSTLDTRHGSAGWFRAAGLCDSRLPNRPSAAIVPQSTGRWYGAVGLC